MNAGFFSLRSLGNVAGSFAIAASLLTVAPKQASALDGLPQYALGVDTLFTAAFPPFSGILLNSYELYYGASTYKDVYGRKSLNKFDLDVAVQAFRAVAMWDTTILGARPITFAVVAGSYINGDLSPLAGVNLKNDQFGLADVSFGQLLQWTKGSWNFAAGGEFYTPSGYWSAKNTFNNGGNVWSFYPQAMVTYTDDDNNHASLKVQYGSREENPRTLYRSGDHVIIDGSVGFGINKVIGLDLAGFALLQVQDDTSATATIARGGRSRLFGLGPQLRFTLPTAVIAVKYTREFGARNAPEGHRFWVQAGFPLYIVPPAAAPEPTWPAS